MNTPPQNPVSTESPWTFDIPDFSAIQLSENFDAQCRDSQNASAGNIEPLAVPEPADSTDLLNMFGNRKASYFYLSFTESI